MSRKKIKKYKEEERRGKNNGRLFILTGQVTRYIQTPPHPTVSPVSLKLRSRPEEPFFLLVKRMTQIVTKVESKVCSIDSQAIFVWPKEQRGNSATQRLKGTTLNRQKPNE